MANVEQRGTLDFKNGLYLELDEKLRPVFNPLVEKGILSSYQDNGSLYISVDEINELMRVFDRKFKFSPMILKAYDRVRHIPLEEAYNLIEEQNDSNLQVDKLKQAISNNELRVYNFKGQQFIDRLDIGRVYHQERKYKEGLTIERYFSREGENPFNSVGEYHEIDLFIQKEGKKDFSMPNAYFPKSWENQTANNIVGDKYFFKPTKPEWKEKLKQKIGREYEFSPTHLINRVTNYIADEGFRLGYFKTEEDKKAFADELKWLQINRRFAFNSPVQFNFGIYNEYGVEGGGGINYYRDPETGEVKKIEEGCYVKPQGHACFIKGPKDDLESILMHMVHEGAIFSSGSGIGQNIGVLRGEGELLSGGGFASGPLSFFEGYDKNAGGIKSGGKSRRAARWTGMDYNHRDIMKFIRAKIKEDKKCLDLIKLGYNAGMDGESARTVAYQNTNITVRADDEFFNAVENDGKIQLRNVTDGKVVEEISARQMLKEIAFGSWRIGDPAIQYESEIQRMHTCKNSGKQQATNPCSEYLFLDDTSCNLLSHNLLAYCDERGNFNVEGYGRAVKLTAIASDIINDAVSYPVEDIATISTEFRTVGVGNCNVGSLLMRKGVPYDSEEGRAIIAAITALMTGKVYEASIELAERLDPFVHFEFNKRPFIEVMKKHQKNLDEIVWDHVSDSGLREAAYKSWDNIIRRGEVFGFRNAQATVYAPTGTIAFLMHADTTGIEPAYALKIGKELAGGGFVNIVNMEVPNALRNLGYNDDQIKDIKDFIDKNDVVVGAPHIKPEHYPIFDTANGDAKGWGSINFEGHVKMLGAVQPFVSGAISKTCNLPESSTVKDIYDSYLLGKKLGLKALAVFRDESKPTAALKRKPEDFIELKRGEKEDLPFSGNSFRQAVSIGRVPFLINIGEYNDGRPGEIVIESYTSDSTLGALLKIAGIDASTALKRGVDLEDIVKKWVHGFEPKGFVTVEDENGRVIPHPYIKQVNSPLDFIRRLTLLHYKGDISIAQEPEKVDTTKLRGYTHGAFRTYKKLKTNDWDFETVINDPELGGFETSRGKLELSNGSKNNLNNSRGVTCPGCGSLMRQISSNCFSCERCGDKIGGCGM
ncbi:vitamin B12-dependent ribonucleotide reductase [Candidatus Pacearchaeota archaeon]|nr:vitamin B12-dependent ribonucleotide reductase [Candidatus Pacearchaeota archaeon]